MIFYFSGTGNSKHIAEKVSGSTGERLVYITESTIEKNETYDIKKNESIGFIFPVYWYCIPTIVEKFILQLKLTGLQNQYVYAIATYGIDGGNVMDRLIKMLKNKQLQIKGIFGVKMVDNYVVGYNIMNKDKQRVILNDAEVEADKIIPMIERRENIQYIKKGKKAFVTPITGYCYRKTNHTKKFFATQNCNSCKQCETSCPCNAIHMLDGKPMWEGDCTFCLKCIHSCKQSAIQYGKFTEKRDRYQYLI
jgi:ferredoxin